MNVLLCGIGLMAILASCDSPASAKKVETPSIVGNWHHDDGTMLVEYSFLSGGTGSRSSGPSGTTMFLDSWQFTWATVNSTLTLVYGSDPPESYAYTISGDILTFDGTDYAKQ